VKSKITTAGGEAGNQLSTFNGCFVPCLLTILGAVLFLRLGFAVGMMGMLGSLGILVFSEIVSCITITSFSAIVSNGRMEGGGAYVIISRNLGPAFGGASGLLLWITYCLNATFNVVAFVDVIVDTYIPSESSFGSSGRWFRVALASGSLLPLLAVAYIGAGSFARVNAIVFAGLAASCATVAGSLFFGSREFELPGGSLHTFTPFNTETLRDNLWPQPVASNQCAQAGAFGMGRADGSVCTLQLVFSVIFPAVVGMMEGLNLSGDLKRPERSIPLGTFWAVLAAFCIYALLIVGQAGTISREALQEDMNVLQNSTVGGGIFVVLGVATACLSTVLGSLFGAARILQAMARDELFPGLAWLGYGSPKGDEPRPAIILSYLLAQTSLFLGSLDDIAPLLTNFFLLTFCFTDLACVLLELSRTPNFRPTFRIYSWQTSLLNSMLVIAVMFYLSWIYAMCAIAAVLLVYLYLAHRFQANSEWSSIGQAFKFRWSRHNMLAMGMYKPDPKHWRPCILLLAPFKCWAQDPNFSSLIEFLNLLSRSGLLILGQAVIGENLPSDDSSNVAERECSGSASPRQTARNDLCTLVPSFRGFVQISCAPTGRLACYNLLLGSGLGSLAPDCIVVPLLTASEATQELGSEQRPALKPPVACAQEFMRVLCDTLVLRKNLLLAANFQSSHAKPWMDLGRIDLWVPWDFFMPLTLQDVGTEELFAEDCKSQAEILAHMSLILQLGHLASAQPSLQRHVRLLTAAPPGSSESDKLVTSIQVQLRRWLQWARIRHGDVQVLTNDVMPAGGEAGEMPAESTVVATATLRHACQLNRHMRKHSSDAAVLLVLLPSFVEISTTPPGLLVQQLCDLVSGLPPTLLVWNGQGSQVISSSI